MTSDSGDATSGSSAEQSGDRRRITRSFYAAEGPYTQPGYGQQGQQYGGPQYGGQQQYGGQPSAYSHQTGPSLGTGLGTGPGEPSGPRTGPGPEGGLAGPGFGGPQPPLHPGGGHGGRGGRKGGLTGLLAIGGAAVLILAASVGYVVLKPGKTSGFNATAGSPSGDAQQLTTAFLQAWSSGDIAKAASYTDNPAAATAALTQYKQDLNLQKLSGTTGAATPAAAPAAPKSGPKPTSGMAASTTLEKVGMALNADVASPPGSPNQLTGNWSYHSSLTAFQAHSGGWYVHWSPTVLASGLAPSQHLASASIAPVVLSVTDAGGGQLQAYNDPGLTTIASALSKQGSAGQGKPGLGVQVMDAKNKPIPGTMATVISAQNIGQLSTTIDPKAEKAAKTAVAQKPQSAMVVIQPSSGKILAIANNAGQNDFALTAAVAPGSDFKIVTAAALFNNGITSANSSVACPKTYNVGGITIKNDKGESEPPGTPFTTDFAASCNNAFTQFWSPLSSSSGEDKLAYTASHYFGLNRRWNVGVANQWAKYFTMSPNEPNSALAEEAFGQGTLQACPLAMASVAATVDSGLFKQPILVPGTKQFTGAPLPSGTKSQLWQVMRAVVTQGTAAGVGFGPDVYGKTGTADVTSGTQPNSWFVAFAPDKDVAVADVVFNSGYGSKAAAPEVKTLLNGY